MKFKVLLSDWLDKKPVSIHRLSKETGINRITLNRYLTETLTRVDAQKVQDLCNYFECKPGDMLMLVSEETYEKVN